MSKIIVSRTLSFPREKVWELLADFGGVQNYSEGVETSPINPGTPATGLGAERNCHFYDGNNFQERIVDFIENERMGIEVFQTSMPLKSANAVFDLVDADGGSTLTMTFDYVVKFGIIGRIMDSLMMSRMMKSNLSRLLASIEHRMKTGEVIGKGWVPAAA